MARLARNGWGSSIRHNFIVPLLAGAIGFASVFASVSAAAEPSATLAEGQRLLAAGESARAWAALSPLELDEAGSPDFDYLYGIAALDTGRLDVAITALERVLASEPDFAGARMELARARYEAGDYPAARDQFEYLLTQAQPPATRALIDSYLRAMAEGPAARSRFVPYAEIGAGWDSNANTSTDSAIFSSDTYGDITLNPDNVETDSGFVELAGGFQHGLATGPGGSIISSGRASYRFNPDADFVDRAVFSLGTAGHKSWGVTRVTLGGSGYYSWLDGSDPEVGAGVDMGLAWRLDSHWEVASTGRAGVVRYQQDELEILDVDRYLGTLSLVRTGIGALNARAGLVALFGTDEATDDSSPYSNDRLGARVYSGWQMGGGSSLFIEAAYLETDYDDSPGFFGTDRVDEQWTLGVSTEYRDWPARGYRLVPTLRFISTDSTVSLYDYDRFELGVYLRRSAR